MKNGRIFQHKHSLKILFLILFMSLLGLGTTLLGCNLIPSEAETTSILPSVAAKAQGGVYYVAPNGNDSHPGTESQPWQTIQKAADVLTAGDTVYIRAGTYEEQVTPQNSGSVDNIITYAAYPGETVTIDGAGISLPNWDAGLFTIEDISYLKVTGLKVINAGPNDNNTGFYIDNSSHIILENNHTYNTTSSGIGVWNSNNITIDNNEVELACNDGEQEAITIATTNGFEVKNNHVHHGGPGTNGGEGIDVKDGSSNGKVFGNLVHNMQADRTCLYIDAWDKNTFNIEVYQNITHHCGAGITLASEMGGLLENIDIYNNISYQNRSNGLEIGNWGEPGIFVHPIENVNFINNTVYNNGTGGWGGGFFNENPDVTGIVVRNNIFSQNLTSQIINESTASLTVDHNLLDGTQEDENALNGVNFILGDPLFISATEANFHLQANSPAIDSGSDVDAPTHDFDGISRPQDGNDDGSPLYDIGAYERPNYSEIGYLPFIQK